MKSFPGASPLTWALNQLIMLLTEESSWDKAASSDPENTGSRRLAGAVQQSGMEGDYAQTSQNSGGAESFFSGDWHQDLWHLGATREMYGTSLCLELTYTWDPRGIPDSGQCPVEISSQRLIKSSAGLFADTTNVNVEQYQELLLRLRRLEPYGQMLFSKWKVNRHVTLKPLPLLDIEVQQRG